MRGHLHGQGLQKLSLGLPVLLSSGTIKEIENCRGQKGLEHTEKCQRSQGSSHTVCFSSGVRCGAASRMPGTVQFSHLCSFAVWWDRLYPDLPEFMFLLNSRPFPPESWALPLGPKPHPMRDVICTLLQPKCYLRARPIMTPTGIVFTSVLLPRPLPWALSLSSVPWVQQSVHGSSLQNTCGFIYKTGFCWLRDNGQRKMIWTRLLEVLVQLWLQ